MSTLSVKAERSGDVAVMKCTGKIVRGQEVVLRDAVLQEKLTRIVVLDLSGVVSIDCGGLSLLVYLHRSTRGNQAQLKLLSPRRFVHEILTRTRLNHVFDILPSFHADTALPAPVR